MTTVQILRTFPAGLGLRYSIELWSDDQAFLLRELAG